MYSILSLYLLDEKGEGQKETLISLLQSLKDFPLKSDLTNDILCNDNSTKDSFSLL